MDATEFCVITKQNVADLLAGRKTGETTAPGRERRKTPRWPVPGTVELWVANENGVDELRFGTCLNLSPNGIGITTDFELEPGLELPLAIHQPEVSLHGRAGSIVAGPPSATATKSSPATTWA